MAENQTGVIKVGTGHPNRWAFLGAGIVTIGLVISLAFSEEHFSEGLEFLLILGLPAYFICFGLVFGVVRLALRGKLLRSVTRRLLFVLLPCLIIATLLPLLAYHDSRPLTRFRKHVIDPPSASLNLKEVIPIRSFGGPSGEIFRFQVSKEDFATIVKSLGLRTLPFDLARRQKEQGEIEAVPGYRSNESGFLVDELYPEDKEIRQWMKSQYSRPKVPAFYEGPGPGILRVVRDVESGEVILLSRTLDRNENPH